MRCVILNEIHIAQITTIKLLFNKANQVKSWFLIRGENRSTLAKTFQSRLLTNSIHI